MTQNKYKEIQELKDNMDTSSPPILKTNLNKYRNLAKLTGKTDSGTHICYGEIRNRLKLPAMKDRHRADNMTSTDDVIIKMLERELYSPAKVSETRFFEGTVNNSRTKPKPQEKMAVDLMPSPVFIRRNNYNIDFTRNMEKFRIRRPQPNTTTYTHDGPTNRNPKIGPLKADHTISAHACDATTRQPIKRTSSKLSISSYRQEMKRLRLARTTSSQQTSMKMDTIRPPGCDVGVDLSELSRDGSPRPGDCTDRQQPIDLAETRGPLIDATPIRRFARLELQTEFDCKIESTEAEQFLSAASPELKPRAYASDTRQISPQTNSDVLFSPPRYVPYGAVDCRALNSSPTRLPRHTSDSTIFKMASRGMSQHFCSTTALPDVNEIPRCSTPEFPRDVTSPSRTLSTIDSQSETRTPKKRSLSQSETSERNSKRPKRRQSLDTNTTPKIVDSIKSIARTTFGSIRRAASLGSIHRRRSRTNWSDSESSSTTSPSETPKTRRKVRRTPSLSSRLRKRSLSARRDKSRSLNSSPSCFGSLGRSAPNSPETPPHERPRNFQSIGKLMAINPDGSQTILVEPTRNGSLGFFIARDKSTNGIVVSRLADCYPERFFAGLISVDDQILEVDNIPTSDLSLQQVHVLMSSKNMLLLKVLPLIARRE